MVSLICCRAQEETTVRRRINACLIGLPQDFRHVSHYGDRDTQVDLVAGNMSSKCGQGLISQSYRMECIDLKERNGTALGYGQSDVSNVKSDKINLEPPKYAPPPPPKPTQTSL